MSQPLFDQQSFMQSLANDEELARELLAAFIEDSPVRRDSLARALQVGDAAAASKYAHSLKGMCGVIRSQPLIDAAFAMENSAKVGNMEMTRSTFDVFCRDLELVHAEIRSYLKN